MARDDLLGMAESLLHAVNGGSRVRIEEILDDAVLLEDRSSGVQIQNRGVIVELLSFAASGPEGVTTSVDDWMVDEDRNIVIGHLTMRRRVGGIEESFRAVEDLTISPENNRIARIRVLHPSPPAFCVCVLLPPPPGGQINGR
jgi:hypothetical protein